MVCQRFSPPRLPIPALLVYQIVILVSTFLCEHQRTCPHLCLARLTNIRPVCLCCFVQWSYETDSFVPLHPFFHALVFKPCMRLALVGLRMRVCCIICHSSNSLLLAVPGLWPAQFVSMYVFHLPIQMLGSEHTAPQLPGNISSVLLTCAEDGKLQLGAKSYCPFWSFFTGSYGRWQLNCFRRKGVQRSCRVGEALDAAAGTVAGTVVHPLGSYPAHKVPLA